MSWTNLKATISAVIKANNKQEITGTILNSIFNSVINNLGANASFAGIATPETPLVVQDGPTFWIAGQAGTYNLGGTGVVVGHATFAIFTWDCSTWNYGLMPISGVITVDNLIEAVQEATEQIRADLASLREQINSELQAYVNDGSYNRETKKIELKHDNAVLALIDAADFIVDGMVDDVRIENGMLVIDFNTASGKQDIEIPLTDIFNPSNYYTRVEVDNALALKANLTNGLVPDSELPKADAAGTIAGIVKLKTNNQGVNRSGLTIASDGSLQVFINKGLSIDEAGRLNAAIESAATDADVEEGTSTDKALTPSNIGKIKSDVNNSLSAVAKSGNYNDLINRPFIPGGYDYVEIGGIKWAKMNIGAESETDYGLYFQWGDIKGYTKDEVGSATGQKYFGWGDYKYSDGSSSPTQDVLTKYNPTDGIRTLELEDDAAYINWGSQWRMPTEDDFQTLLNSTTNEWVTNYKGSGINGRLFTDKTDSTKTLFFPAAGECSDGQFKKGGNFGTYWSSSIYIAQNLQGAYLSFYNGGTRRTSTNRYIGFPVRAIKISDETKFHKVAVTGNYNDLTNLPDIDLADPNAKFAYKNVGIIGDSISTYEGWLPSDITGYDGSIYSTFFPRSDVNSVDKTWWYQLAKMMNINPNTNISNCSWSGSKVIGDSASTINAYAGCSTRRITDLSLRFNGTAPDIIIVYISCNDWANEVPVGTWAVTDAIPSEGDITDFRSAYALMLNKIHNQYPNARIFCCTIIDDLLRDKTSGWPSNNNDGVTTYQWNQNIKELAYAFGCDVIDLHSCGINYSNITQYTIDMGLHPNAPGHLLMAKKIYAELLAKY